MTAEIILKNGDAVKINDHVYCSPSWATRDGTPYSVARIMEFLPPEDVAKGRGKGKEIYTRVRLAWYYRPGDVSDRVVVDCRLLLAAIYSEICEINQLRAKCFVLHRDKISDLAGWKKRPDRFYFNRLFDPYIRKEFDVIQTSDVKNLPDNVRDVLQSRYEYVVAEKEIVSDLTDNIRLCDACQLWCAPQDTVKCDRCKNFFHMACVQPPLLAKPSRGYGWTCAPCSRQHEEEVDSHEVIRHPTPAPGKPKSSTGRSRGPGRPRKDRKQAELEENAVIKHFKMWPFRYFGVHTFPEDTLDPDDFIFPRIATRVGPKYQANVPPVLDPTPLPDVEERGVDSTLEVLSYVNKMSEDELAEFEERKAGMTARQELRSNVDWLSEVVKVLSTAWHNHEDLGSVRLKTPLRPEKWKKSEVRYIDRDWSLEEKSAFEDAIHKYGAELRPVREEIGTRSLYEVVRYYGHWKNSKIGEQNARIRRERTTSKPSSAEIQIPVSSDDEGSLVKQPRSNVICASCKARESEQWWKAPKGLSSNILCDECGITWRKYADFTKPPIRESSLPAKGKGVEKREGTPLNGPNPKRAKTSPPPSSTSVPQLRCLACNHHGPVGKVLKCRTCEFQIHAGTCGVVLESKPETWVCDLCQNEETQDASLHMDCVLCPKVHRDRDSTDRYPPADTFLRAEKPTEGQGWAHVLCAVFIPEITFSDVARLRLVEGVSVVSPHRWSTVSVHTLQPLKRPSNVKSQRCCLCTNIGGAVVRCCDCSKEFHVSCAWAAGHRFGFDIQAVKHSKRDQTTMVQWNGESGNMVPVICCKEHSTRRIIHEICETNDVGETAVQVYCKNYKTPPLAHTHALLRKARRLDQVLGTFADVLATTRPAQQPPPVQCFLCKTKFSPFFYPSGPEQWSCHRCHYESKETAKQMNGATV